MQAQRKRRPQTRPQEQRRREHPPTAPEPTVASVATSFASNSPSKEQQHQRLLPENGSGSQLIDVLQNAVGDHVAVAPHARECQTAMSPTISPPSASRT